MVYEIIPTYMGSISSPVYPKQPVSFFIAHMISVTWCLLKQVLLETCLSLPSKSEKTISESSIQVIVIETTPTLE